MKGRFEKPRNKFSAEPTEQQPQTQRFYGESPAEGNAPQNFNDPNSYPQEPFNGQDWEQNSYENQFEDCNQNGFEDRQPPKKEKSGWGWGLLSFFLPLLGLIFYFAWKRRKPRSAKSAAIGGLVGIIIQLLLILVLIIGGSMYYNNMLDKVNIIEMTRPVYTQETEETSATEEAVTEAVETVVTEPPKAKREDFINFLIVGQASRANEEERFADTMMVCTLNKFDNSITVTSLLRDSFVQPPAFRGHNFGHIKLTTVYHLGSHYDNGNVAGSMELINNTLFTNFGLEIDYNVEISFEIFEQVVNQLGGVDIELNEAEAKYLTKHFDRLHWDEERFNFEAGPAHLDGYTALTYARMRKADGDGESDIKRTERQRKFMQRIMEKIKTMNIADLQNIAESVLPMVTTNMTKSEISEMLKTVLTMLPTMEFKSGGTCPANYSGDMVDIYDEGFKHSVLRFNVNETKKTMRELTLGEIPEDKK